MPSLGYTLNYSDTNASTSIFYDLYKKDRVGHKIICTIECEKLDREETLTFIKKKVSLIIKKYPHFGCRFVNYSWVKTECIELDRMVFKADMTREGFVEKTLSQPLPEELPGWQAVVTDNNCILFVCDHVYGDGAFIANTMRMVFDDGSLNNIPASREKKKMTLVSKIFLFFKIIYLLYKRLCLGNTCCRKTANVDNSVKQICLAKLSLSSLKNIQRRFSCSDGTHITINDILQTLLVKTNSEYFGKEVVTSAAMFNMRENMDDFSDKNKLGYILMANKSKEGGMPENLLTDVHDFMQFYKETPATWIISTCMHLYYAWDRKKSSSLIRNMNQHVDFIMSNYMFQYKDKHIMNGIKIMNAYGSVTPCDAPQIYSISTYNDNVNIYLTYHTDKISNIEKLRKSFDESVNWMKN